MFFVAVAELVGTLEEEIARLASVLGVSAYDVRGWLSGVLPRIVYQSTSQPDALNVLSQIRARGHGAVLCDTREVCPGSQMVQVHRFAFDDTTFWANDGGGEHIAFADVGVMIQLARRTNVIRTTVENEVSRVSSRRESTVAEEHARAETVLEHSLYLFPRETLEGRPSRPWLLQKRAARYLALGPAMKTTGHENFAATIAMLRARTTAIYDDRFASHPRIGAELVAVRGHDAATPSLSDKNVDLVVHALATWLARDPAGPYRTAQA